MATAVGLDSGGIKPASTEVVQEKPSRSLEEGVPAIPLDLDKRKISPKTKKLVLARLGAAEAAENQPVESSIAEDTLADATATAPSDKAAEPCSGAPGDIAAPHEDTRTSPSAVTPSSDLEKKQRRAERFGLELQISESEKRNIRAARFGPNSGGTEEGLKSSSPASKEAESEKRKARAARFGTDQVKEVKGTSSALDDEKKKARAARFGLEVKSDSAEVEKRKARAERFALSQESPSSKKPRVADVGAVASG